MASNLQKETRCWFTDLMKDRENRGKGSKYMFSNSNTCSHTMGKNPLHDIYTDLSAKAKWNRPPAPYSMSKLQWVHKQINIDNSTHKFSKGIGSHLRQYRLCSFVCIEQTIKSEGTFLIKNVDPSWIKYKGLQLLSNNVSRSIATIQSFVLKAARHLYCAINLRCLCIEN